MWERRKQLAKFSELKVLSPEYSFYLSFSYLSQEVKKCRNIIFFHFSIHSIFFPFLFVPGPMQYWVNTQQAVYFQGLYAIPSCWYIVRISQLFLPQIYFLEIKVLKDTVPHTKKHRLKTFLNVHWMSLGAQPGSPNVVAYMVFVLPQLKLPPVSKAVLMNTRHTISILNYGASLNFRLKTINAFYAARD